MSINIRPILLGFDQCYLVSDRGLIMIDGGSTRHAKKITAGICLISESHKLAYLRGLFYTQVLSEKTEVFYKWIK